MYFNALYASHELVRVEENQSSHLSSRVITNEITVNIMTYLSIEDLGRACQVSKEWNALTLETKIWQVIRDKIHGDYLFNEATKENAKLHWLRVIVNASSDLGQIGRWSNGMDSPE